MAIQILFVAVLVAASAVYAVWTLMPVALRRPLARALLGLPLPAWLAARLQRAAKVGSGCGCDGCDRAPKKADTRAASGAGVREASRANAAAAAAPRPQAQPLTFHPRRR